MIYYCPVCNYTATKKSSLDYHYKSIKHKYNVLLKDFDKVEEINVEHELEIEQLKNENKQLCVDKISILENALNSSNQIILSPHNTIKSSHDVLNKTLDNTEDNGAVVEKSLSVMQYLMTNCMDAPDIDKLDVKGTLELSDSQYKAIIYDPLNMADVILEKYFTNKTAKEISLYCADASRKKFIIKENGKWVKDPGGEKIKKYIIIPIARKTYDFNEESFNKQIKSVGGPGKLSGVQLKERKHALLNCCKMEKGDTHDAIIKKLTGCDPTMVKSSDQVIESPSIISSELNPTTSDLDCSSDDSYENDFDYSKEYNVSFIGNNVI
jgi:hypothetical protein